MDPTSQDPIRRLEDLAGEADRGFSAIRKRVGASMQCQAGCSDCCRARLSITRVEEAFLRRGLARIPGSIRKDMALAARDKKREMCPALDAQGRCRVYTSRPLICRSYGVPLRYRREVSIVNPPVIGVCDKNFIGTPLKLLPAEDVFDQTDLDAAVAEIDDDYCKRNALPAGERVPIAQILGSLDSVSRS